MKKKEIIGISIVLFVITCIFFYKVFLGFVPFPGDLLVSEYGPWSSYSYLGYNPGSIPNKAQYFDTIRQLYPWKTEVIESLKQFSIPLWNPYNFSGSPLLANVQSAVFYPFNIFYFVLPQIFVWTGLIFIQPFLSAFFTYLYVRKIGVSKIPALLSALAYGFSLFTTVFLEYNTVIQVALWLPLFLLSVEIFLTNKKISGLLLFLLAFLCSFFAGHIQLFGFELFFVSVYIIARILTEKTLFKNKFRLGFIWSIVFLLGFGITAIQLLPTLELILYSARVSQEHSFLINNLLLQPIQLILFLVPDFFGNPASRNYLLSDAYPGNAIYIGIAPFLLSFFTIPLFKKNYFIKFFWIATIILLFFFLRTPISEYIYSLNIPILSNGSPTNGIFLLSFCLSVLSGFGLEKLSKKTNRNDYIILGLLIIFLLIVSLIFVIKPFEFNSKNTLLSLGITLVSIISIGILLRFKSLWKFIGLCLIILTLIDLFYLFHKFNPFVLDDLVYPQNPVIEWLQKNGGINRYWGYGSANIEANFATQERIFSPDGYDPLYPKIYGEFIQSTEQGNMGDEFTNQTRSDAIVSKGFGEGNYTSNKYRNSVLNFLGVKYILDKQSLESGQKTFPQEQFVLKTSLDTWNIYENKNALPRAFLTNTFDFYTTPQEFSNKFFKSTNNRLVLLKSTNQNKKYVQDINTSTTQTGSVSVRKYLSNEVQLQSDASQTSILVLSDTNYPGWNVYIDSEIAPLLTVNYAFRGVVVPEGDHIIVFKYEPESFYWGAIGSIISIGILLVLIVKYRKYEF